MQVVLTIDVEISLLVRTDSDVVVPLNEKSQLSQRLSDDLSRDDSLALSVKASFKV
jgi:hypothetical protein